jgi:prepilin-type processing-associated H-X9-DG protein
MSMHLRSRAFSLAELVVVVSILLLLASLFFVVVGGTYDYAKQVKCQHRLEQIGHACTMYAARNRGVLPKSWDPVTRRRWYETLGATTLPDLQVLACPAADDPPIALGGGEPAAEQLPRAVRDALLDALRWLKRNQDPNTGQWYSVGTHTAHSGVTGLALMAFLSYGCTEKRPAEFADTVRKAALFLMARQHLTEDRQRRTIGSFIRGGKESDCFYSQGICVMALAEAAIVLETPELRVRARKAAQRGIDYILSRQPANGGFTYVRGSNRVIDVSVTCWQLQALASAKAAGLSIAPRAKGRAQRFLALCSRRDGSVPYQVDLRQGADYFHPRQRMTAATFACRLLTDKAPRAPEARKHARWLREQDPYLQKPRQMTDLFYCYYMTLANVQVGGPTLKEWRGALVPPLLGKQKHDGSWGADVCFFHNHAGTVYTTALACLTLEAVYLGDWRTDPSPERVLGRCSYGYNNQVGHTDRTVGADTIIAMDYMKWEIDRDAANPICNDDPFDVAARHGGRANALLGDGSVRTFYPEELTEGRFTPEPGD